MKDLNGKLVRISVLLIVLINETVSLAGLVAIGYGIKKLQISCHIIDDLVSVDDIQEKIQENLEDLVQSTDVQSFTKL